MLRRHGRARGWALAALLVGGCELADPAGADEGQGVISGRVTDVSNGANVTYATIALRGAETQNVVSATGYYLLDGLVAGTYAVTVVPPTGYEVAPNTNGTAPVQIVAAESRTVNFQLRRVVSTSVPPQARD